MSDSDKAIKLPSSLFRLPPMPQVLMRALELTRDPQVRRAELADVLALDQGLTGLFLQMVNSAYYGLRRRVTSLDEAIGYLGFETVEKTIFAMSARDALVQPLPAYMLERQMLWQHSIAVAEGSDWLAQRRKITPSSEVYVAGLLHDVGKLAIDLTLHRQPDWGDVASPGMEDESWVEVERRVAGADHAEVGAAIVRGWNLPDRVVEAVACHHQPEKAEIDPKFTATVHIANVASMMAGIGLGVDGMRYGLSESAVSLLDWSEEEMGELIGQMQSALEKAEQLLGKSI